eukprot:scaffold47820_cov20-Tisochrysis_lutea.AAC.1
MTTPRKRHDNSILQIRGHCLCNVTCFATAGCAQCSLECTAGGAGASGANQNSVPRCNMIRVTEAGAHSAAMSAQMVELGHQAQIRNFVPLCYIAHVAEAGRTQCCCKCTDGRAGASGSRDAEGYGCGPHGAGHRPGSDGARSRGSGCGGKHCVQQPHENFERLLCTEVFTSIRWGLQAVRVGQADGERWLHHQRMLRRELMRQNALQGAEQRTAACARGRKENILK